MYCQFLKLCIVHAVCILLYSLYCEDCSKICISQVQLTGHNTVEDLREIKPDVCMKMYGSSAIVDLGLPRQINKPIEVQAPVSDVQKPRESRPKTSNPQTKPPQLEKI